MSGSVLPLGVGTEDSWSGIVAGRSGVGPITSFDAARYSTRFAGEVPGFYLLEWLDKGREEVRTLRPVRDRRDGDGDG